MSICCVGAAHGEGRGYCWNTPKDYLHRTGVFKAEKQTNYSMYQYVPVHTRMKIVCPSMYFNCNECIPYFLLSSAQAQADPAAACVGHCNQYVLVASGTYQYIPVHTSTYHSCLVHTGTYWYILVWHHALHGRPPAPLNDHLSTFSNNFFKIYNIIIL